MTSGVPVVSVITPTWHRKTMLLRRCIPSVQAQGYPAVEHIVVSDGPDPELAAQLSMPWLDGWKNLWYRELPKHPPDPHKGVPCRLAGLEYASGTYITYCDDDDILRRYHCQMLAAMLDAHPDAGFAVSRMLSYGPGGSEPVVVGAGPLACGQVGTPMIMHRRELTDDVATWGPSSQFEDWELVERWVSAGVPYVRVDAETCEAWPSLWRGDGADPELEPPPPPPGLAPGEARVWGDGQERARGGQDLARPAPW
jgi:hypothetical protein